MADRTSPITIRSLGKSAAPIGKALAASLGDGCTHEPVHAATDLPATGPSGSVVYLTVGEEYAVPALTARKKVTAQIRPSIEVLKMLSDLKVQHDRDRDPPLLIQFGEMTIPRSCSPNWETIKVVSPKPAPGRLRAFFSKHLDVRPSMQAIEHVTRLLENRPAARPAPEITDLEGAPTFTEFIVDGSISRELSQRRLGEETIDRLRRVDFIDLKYHYVGWKMAQHWQDLVNANSYGHRELEFFLKAQLPNAIEEAGLSLEDRIDVFSLGPGDGQLDVSILRTLKEHVDIGLYSMIDISIELLILAVNTVIDSGALGIGHVQTDIKAVMSDFEKDLNQLGRVLDSDGRKRFYLLNGYTFGNSSERNLSDIISKSMRKGDLFLFDVRLHTFGAVTPTDGLGPEQQEILRAPYESRELEKFALGPVEEATNYAIEHSDLRQELEFTYDCEVKKDSQVDSAVNVFLGCRGLYGNNVFRESIGLGPISAGTRQAQEQNAEHLTLAKVTYYHLDDLLRWLTERGLEVVWHATVPRGDTEIGLILCRLRE